MHDILDQPVGEFDWGPEPGRRHRPWSGRAGARCIAALPAAAIALGAALLAVGLALMWTSTARTSRAESAPPATHPPVDSIAGGTDGSEITPTAEPMVVVHVTGQVAHPGIVAVPVTSRVIDAVGAAGGTVAGADLDRINLATPIDDGMQLHVPRIPAPPSPTPDHAGADPDPNVGVSTTGSQPGSPPTTPAAPAAPTTSPALLSPELEAFLATQPDEPSRDRLAPFLEPAELGN